jgi:hypothetical protein
MSNFPCLVRVVSGSGQVRYRLGDRLVDRYLEFVAGRCRPNTLRAVAFDLKVFFAVTGKDPVEVTAADVFEFLAHQRGDRSVVRLADRESGLSARTGGRPCLTYTRHDDSHRAAAMMFRAGRRRNVPHSGACSRGRTADKRSKGPTAVSGDQAPDLHSRGSGGGI